MNSTIMATFFWRDAINQNQFHGCKFFKQNSLIRSIGQKCQISNNETAGSD